MKLPSITLLLALPIGAVLVPAKATLFSQETTPAEAILAGIPDLQVESEIIKAPDGGLVLSHSFSVKVPVKAIWEAFVTEEGYSSWAAPKAKIDLRTGGTIQAHYDEEAQVGDPGTITLHIVNFVPERVLTLRAEAADHFPEIMKEDDGNLMQVILFEPLGESLTRVTSYGVGYRDVPEYRELLAFFEPANTGLYQKLKDTLESQEK